MKYVGDELFLFERAQNWKAYWASFIHPYIRGAVLEVGAGIGANTRLFADKNFSRWVCLEPDPELLTEAKKRNADSRYKFIAGTIANINQTFDVIFYIDVLEHIGDDHAELGRATARLREGGTLIVLVPAHQFLFSPLDEAVGHFRRYNKRTLKAAAPKNLSLERILYLDSAGCLASFTNKILLRRSLPTPSQVRLWDSFLVSISKLLDTLFCYTVGKSVLGIWKKSISMNR